MIAALKAYAADILAALLIVAVAGWGIQTWRLHSAQSARDAALAQIQTMVAEGRASQAQQAAISAQREAQIKEVTNDAQNQIKAAQADSAAASSALDSVRKQLATYRSAARKDSSAAGSSPSVQGQDPLDLLGQLLSGSDAALAATAGYADEIKVRGLACERAYDSLAAMSSADSR